MRYEMIIFIGLLALVAILGLRKEDGKERDYMSVAMTNSIKGIFLCFVFFSHIYAYQEFSHPVFDAPYEFFRKMGQCIVVMFLFYSGYGVMESIKKKGDSYVQGIPVQRVLKVLLQFDAAILIFWLYRLATGTHYDLKMMLLTFVGWKSIGNSNWYIFSILWLYLFTFIAFRVFKKNHLKAVVGIILLSLLYMVILCKAGRPYYCYDTTLCYAWGMLFSLYRKKIESFLNENRNSWLFFLFVSVAGYLSTYFYRNSNHIIYQIWVFCFAASILIFTMRYVVDSKPLQWLGRNLFPLYILQRLPMLLLENVKCGGGNARLGNWLYVAACFVITLVITVVYQKTIARLIGTFTAFLSSGRQAAR